MQKKRALLLREVATGLLNGLGFQISTCITAKLLFVRCYLINRY